jgi:hypothetical protein
MRSPSSKSAALVLMTFCLMAASQRSKRTPRTPSLTSHAVVLPKRSSLSLSVSGIGSGRREWRGIQGSREAAFSASCYRWERRLAVAPARLRAGG